MNSYVSVYTTYDKTRADQLTGLFKENSLTIKLKTSKDSSSDDIIYELYVLEDHVNDAHEIIISNGF